MDNLRGGAGRGGPELEILYGEDALDRLLPMVRRKIKKAPVTACVATGVWNGVLVEASRGEDRHELRPRLCGVVASAGHARSLARAEMAYSTATFVPL
jgi:hypothetical protein